MAKSSKNTSRAKRKTTPKAAAKPATLAQPIPDIDTTKTVQPSRYRLFRLGKRRQHTTPKLLAGRKLAKQTFVLLWRNKKSLSGILLLYGLIQLVLVRGLVASDFKEISDLVTENLGGWAEFAGSIALLAYLAGAGGQGIPAEGSVYLFILTIIASLTLIWAARHMYAEKSFRIRDAYYRGMYPLIPFFLIIFLALLQFIPLMLGAWVYQATIVSGLATTLLEVVFWLVLIGLLLILSFYMLTNTVIALYVITLPDMDPMKALRSAKGLVKYRRLQIFWRVLFLTILMSVIMAIILVPVIMVVPGFAPWIFYILSVVSLAYVHIYMYGLYRELLREA